MIKKKCDDDIKNEVKPQICESQRKHIKVITEMNNRRNKIIGYLLRDPNLITKHN